MKSVAVLSAAAGIAAAAALVAYYGAGGIVEALLAVGLGGFAAVCAIHLVLTGLMGLAWRALLAGERTMSVIWARLLRDAGSEALPLSQVGGYVIGARALVLAGAPAMLAAASTIVDVTLEFLAQLVYTALGLALLARMQPDSAVALPILLGLVFALVVAAIFVVVQRRGLAYFDRIARILGEGWAERSAAGAAALHQGLAAIYRRRGGLAVSFALHFACWVASAIEIWVALWFAGQPLSFAAVLVVESLLYAIRTAVFFVPHGVGVQEGSYVLLGAAFGLTPDLSIALSLLKRARDLAIGLPAIAIWQGIEGGRLWRRRRGERPGVTGM